MSGWLLSCPHGCTAVVPFDASWDLGCTHKGPIRVKRELPGWTHVVTSGSWTSSDLGTP